MKIPKFVKVYDIQNKFVGFYVGDWNDDYVRIALVPSSEEEVNLTDFIDFKKIEDKVMNNALFLGKSREKMLKKLQKEYGNFPEKDYFYSLLRYALDHKISVVQSYTTNIFYILLHKSSITAEESYISLMRTRESYPEIEVVRKLEPTRVHGKKLRGYIGQISGIVDVKYKTFSVQPSFGFGYQTVHEVEILAPFTTGDATFTLHMPFYVDFQYGDYIVVRGAKERWDSDLFEVSSLYSLTRGVLWRKV